MRCICCVGNNSDFSFVWDSKMVCGWRMSNQYHQEKSTASLQLNLKCYMIIWVFLIYGYICMYTLRSLIWKQDTCCIKMRRKHQRNSSCFPSENRQIYVVKLWATYWVGYELSTAWAQGAAFPPGMGALGTAPTCPVLLGRGSGRSHPAPANFGQMVFLEQA